MTRDQEIVVAQLAYEQAVARRRELIEQAVRERSVSQARIAEITGVSRETIRVWLREAGVPRDERKVRTVR